MDSNPDANVWRKASRIARHRRFGTTDELVAWMRSDKFWPAWRELWTDFMLPQYQTLPACHHPGSPPLEETLANILWPAIRHGLFGIDSGGDGHSDGHSGSDSDGESDGLSDGDGPINKIL